MGTHATISKGSGSSMAWGELMDEYMPMGSPGGTLTPDTSIAVAARVQGPSQQNPDGTWSQPVMGELLLKTSGVIEVPGYVSQAVHTAEVIAAVAAATPAPEKVLPDGYTHAVNNGKVRLACPGGRWVEYDPTANTFLVG